MNFFRLIQEQQSQSIIIMHKWINPRPYELIDCIWDLKKKDSFLCRSPRISYVHRYFSIKNVQSKYVFIQRIRSTMEVFLSPLIKKNKKTKSKKGTRIVLNYFFSLVRSAVWKKGYFYWLFFLLYFLYFQVKT